jgi:hypothetical protein
MGGMTVCDGPSARGDRSRRLGRGEGAPEVFNILVQALDDERPGPTMVRKSIAQRSHGLIAPLPDGALAFVSIG